MDRYYQYFFWYHGAVLNCTWDEVESASVMRKLELPAEEQQKQQLRSLYETLREKYRKPRQASGSSDPAPGSE